MINHHTNVVVLVFLVVRIVPNYSAVGFQDDRVGVVGLCGLGLGGS